tara:strand:- start:316 stop:1227 length:912 start_codon:yes stop_codon:yes gene_type:complete
MNLYLKNLSKTYSNGVKALINVSMNISNGMFGLLGPNGAGKSTLMRTIATLQEPDTGEARLGDIDLLKNPIELRKILGYLPQSFGVYPKMNAYDLLHYMGQLKGISNKRERDDIVASALELTNLYDVRFKEVAGYSGGMKQRFGIAQLLLNKPKLIIVDEPTAGLDPAERQRFLNVLREIGTDNIVIFSTHIVDDVKELCTDMAIMDKGEILLQSTPKEAISAINENIWGCNIKKEELEQCEQKYNVLSSGYNEDNSLFLRVYSEKSPGKSFEKKQPNLEDTYFVTLKKLRISHTYTKANEAV